MTVIDFAENFAQNFFERNADKQHALGAAVLLPYIVRDFHHAQFMGTSAQVEEAEVAHQAATHDLVGRHGGIEPTRHQHQGLLKRTQRVATNTVVLIVNHKQPLVANFNSNFNFGLFQLDSSRTALTPQLAADVFLDFHRGKRVLASALATHRKELARQCIAEVQLALLNDVVEVTQRVLVDLQEMRDARHAAQAFGHFFQGFRVGYARLQLDVVPHARHHHSRVQIAEHSADVFGQLTDETHPNRTALDSDFGEDFND